MSIQGNSYKYIGEGNAHIVLELLNTNKVVRLFKQEKHIANKIIELSINFVNNVMMPFLSYFNDKYDVIEIPEEDIYALLKYLEPVRPMERKNGLRVSSCAVIAPNLLILNPIHDSFCIEIKPKEGYMSKKFKEFTKCYYCMKQLLKLKEKRILTMSKYCPLDLFSGDKRKMKYAIMNLIENPQNNFKLFHNDQMVYSDKSCVQDFHTVISKMGPFKNSIQLFLEFIVQILSNNKVSEIRLSETDSNFLQKSGYHCYDKSNLQSGSFLNNLLKVQRLSENVNVINENININGGINYVPSILDHVKNLNPNIRCKIDELLGSLEPKHLALISAVAKDCSIMISFSLNSLDGYPSIKIGEHRISYRIAATDLEPKPEKTLIKREKTEEKIIILFKEYLNNMIEKKSLVIQPHSETKAKQLEAWQHLIIDYLKATKQATIDIRESQNSPLFNNVTLNRKLSQEAILTILEDMAKAGKAAPIDKSRNVWEVYWHSLDEWGNIVYNWACNSGLNNTVCTLFELREGENTVDEEFHGLDANVLIKALKALEVKGKCELMEFDDSQGVKFF